MPTVRRTKNLNVYWVLFNFCKNFMLNKLGIWWGKECDLVSIQVPVCIWTAALCWTKFVDVRSPSLGSSPWYKNYKTWGCLASVSRTSTTLHIISSKTELALMRLQMILKACLGTTGMINLQNKALLILDSISCKLCQGNNDRISWRNCCCWFRPFKRTGSRWAGSTGFCLKERARANILDLNNFIDFICLLGSRKWLCDSDIV